VLGDELRLGQIINNLISNAIKFTPLGGSITVQVEGEREEHGIVACLFKVTDTGIGIPAAQQLKIFDAFVQADSSVSRKHGGTGLGLTISANLAALMGGAITLESKEGHGSSFTLRVPLIVASEAEVVRAALSDTDSVLSTPHSSGAYVRERRALPTACTVLVAEDNRINQRLAQRVLEAEGFSVVLAGDGVQALQVLDRQSIDIVLMDCQMPGMDGYEATRRIRAHPLTAVASVPIVALTAHAMDEDREKCLAAGMNEYISKPFQRGHLIRTIRRLVSARRT
jgi:CheY-like chemotaxis protein